jgi:hypothetical protein
MWRFYIPKRYEGGGMPDWLVKIIAHPAFDVTNFAVGIIGVLLAIYFYRRSIKKRGLSYKVKAVRTPIVRTGAASQMSVLHNGREIKSDITAVHVAIWNQGSESIRQEHMLRPMIIFTENSAPILEAGIRYVKRSEIGLRLDESRCDYGQLEVHWDILEEQDGGIVQIIYEGSPELLIAAYAVPEGQRRIMDCSTPFLPPVIGIERSITLLILCMFGYLLIEFLRQGAYVFQIAPVADASPPLGEWWEWIGRWSFFINVVVVGATAWLVFRAISKLRRAKPPFEW